MGTISAEASTPPHEFCIHSASLNQSEGGYPNGLCFPCANVWGLNHGQKLLSSLLSSLLSRCCLVVVSLSSRCRRAPPHAMRRKIRRARPPLSYAVSIRTHRRGDPPVRSTQSRYGCFNKNNPPRRPSRKIDTTSVWLFNKHKPPGRPSRKIDTIAVWLFQ